jgi:hypothetical protein
MKHLINLIKATLIFCLLSIVHKTFADDVLSLPEDANHLNLWPYSEYYVDTAGNKDLNDIIQINSKFLPLKQKKLTPFIAPTWIKTSLINNSNKNHTWYLYTGLPYISELNAYIQNANGQKLLLSLGKKNTFQDRPIQDGQLIIPLHFKPKEKITLYLQYKSIANLPLAMEIFTKQTWQNFSTKNTLFNGIIFGLLLYCFGIIAIQLIVKPEKGYLYLLAFILSGFLLVADTSGYTGQYIWPAQTQIFEWLHILTILLPLILYFLYMSHSLNLKRNAPYLYFLYLIIVSCATLIIAFGFVLDSSPAVLLLSPVAA